MNISPLEPVTTVHGIGGLCWKIDTPCIHGAHLGIGQPCLASQAGGNLKHLG
jgi:hypothetical protein